MSIKIRITAAGIHGKPTEENPTGEYPVGYEFETDAEMPAGWAGRAEVVQPDGVQLNVYKSGSGKAPRFTVALALGGETI